MTKLIEQIRSLPGVMSLEKEPDGWCCYLHYGWTTDDLGGGGTIIDSSLKTIKSYVTGAYQMEEQACTPTLSLTN